MRAASRPLIRPGQEGVRHYARRPSSPSCRRNGTSSLRRRDCAESSLLRSRRYAFSQRDPKKCPVARQITSTPSRAALPRHRSGNRGGSPRLRRLCASAAAYEPKTSSPSPAWQPHRLIDRNRGSVTRQHSHTSWGEEQWSASPRRHLVSTGRSTQLRSTGRRSRASPLGVAAGAWSTVSSGLTDTAASISRVMADLRTGGGPEKQRMPH